MPRHMPDAMKKRARRFRCSPANVSPRIASRWLVPSVGTAGARWSTNAKARPIGTHEPPSRPLLAVVGSVTGVPSKCEKGAFLPAKFVIKKGPTGKFRFNLLASNGQVVATSETYNSKASAMGGIRSIKKIAADAEVEDQTTKEWAAVEAARKAAAATQKAASSARKKLAQKVPEAIKKS